MNCPLIIPEAENGGKTRRSHSREKVRGSAKEMVSSRRVAWSFTHSLRSPQGTATLPHYNCSIKFLFPTWSQVFKSKYHAFFLKLHLVSRLMYFMSSIDDPYLLMLQRGTLRKLRTCTCVCDWVTLLCPRKLTEHWKPATLEKIKIIIKKRKRKS